MTLPYNVLQANDTTDLLTIFQFVNNSGTDGLFMPIMLLVIWIIIFISTLSEGRQAPRAIIFASFICSLLSILLSIMHMLNPQYMYFIFLVLGGGILWQYLAKSPGI